MGIRFGLVLLLLAIVPACGRVDTARPDADSGAAASSGQRNEVHTAFYPADETTDRGGTTGDVRAKAVPDLAPPTVDQIGRLLTAVEQLHARLDELQNQNEQILAALGIDDQTPAPPPPAGSLADKIIDLQEAVELLAVNDEALRRVIEEQTVTLKPALPSSMLGKLTVENNTDSDRQIWINGTSYWVWARSKLTVQVPAGEVTTKVAGEDAKTWDIAGPGFEERIEIVRRTEAAPAVGQ